MPPLRRAIPVPSVPSSDTPPIPEWANHYWYVMRASALQAKPELTDAEAGQLMASMQAYSVVTPCEKCRAHHAAYFAAHPFTVEQARSPTLALQWVEALKADIEKAEAVVPAAAPAAPAAVPIPRTGVVVRANAVPKRVGGPVIPAASSKRQVGVGVRAGGPVAAVTAPGPRATTAAIANRRQGQVAAASVVSSLALRESLQRTVAHRAGARTGCGCGRR